MAPEVTFPRDDYQHWLDGLVREPRFGARDKLGTANFLDDAARRRGAASVVTGAAVSLARPLREAVTPGFAVDVHYTDGPIGAGTDHVGVRRPAGGAVPGGGLPGGRGKCRDR